MKDLDQLRLSIAHLRGLVSQKLGAAACPPAPGPTASLDELFAQVGTLETLAAVRPKPLAPKSDEREVLAHQKQLLLHCRDVAGRIALHGLGAPAEPQLTDGDLFGGISLLETHADKLNSVLVSAEAARAPKPVAPATAKPATSAPTSQALKLTPMQRVAAAGGIAKINARSEVERLEAALPGLKGISRQIVEGKLSKARAKLAAIA